MESWYCEGCGKLGNVASGNCGHHLCTACIFPTMRDNGRCPACADNSIDLSAPAASGMGTMTTEVVDGMRRQLRAIEETTRITGNLFGILFKEIQQAANRLLILERHMQHVMEEREAQLCEMRAALANTETSFNGIFLWNIADFEQKLSSASSSGRPTCSFSSPAFYTSRAGYKLCARIYLNGDGIGRGQYLSLFIVMMKGKYDTFQKWPFNQFVTFTLIDQSGQGQHVRDSFRADPSSPSFRRPQSEMNIASGCPLFMRLSDLHDKWDNYIQDDNLLIEIKVDTQGLENFGGQN